MYGQFRSPVSLLASLLSNELNTPELIFVTGKSGTGKTTWCLELAKQARLAGIPLHGVISPAVFENSTKTGIDLLDLWSGERRRLAIRRSEEAPDNGLGPRTSGWQFDAATLDWANQALDRITGADLLILDELGPLELLENQGLVSGLRLLDERRFRLACVSVRPLLLATARERWPWAVVMGAQEENRP